jgi:polysaccharide biosynthesis protein PelF
MKIAMMTEGTYPHGFGGVSVWCDQLIRGLPGYDFHLDAIVATEAARAVWTLPENVTSMTRVLLWGAAPEPPGRSRLPRRLIRSFVHTLLDPEPYLQPRFDDLLRELFLFAKHGDLGAELASDLAVRVLSDAWRDQPPGPATPALHDAVTATQLLSHCLRPFSYPTAEADLGHAVTNGLGVLPALAAKWQYGTPMIVTEHGVYLREQYLRNGQSPYRWPVKSLYLAFMRRLCTLGYREAATITPGNIYNRRWEERLGAEPARIRTVYNGVDPANFPAVTGEPAQPTISWVGRVDPIKDLETLLRAFAIVREQVPQARLRLFGSPPPGREFYLDRCQALAAKLKLDGAATFEGRVDDIRDAYDAGTIVALSSVSEGFPYSLIEAMTCGRACVATDVGGVAEAVGDTGFVVPPRNPQEFARACLTLLADQDRRRALGAAARVRALENFTLDGAISRFDEIYSFIGAGHQLPVAAANSAVVAGPPVTIAASSSSLSSSPSSLTWSVNATLSPSGTGGAPSATATLTEPPPGEVGQVGESETGELDTLCEQFTRVCESAVDPLEISSALEFEGLSDQAAADRYGAPDVFALAEEMYRRVPRRPAEPEPGTDPWQLGALKPAMHGLLYGLPTACFPAASRLLVGPGVLTVLVASLIVSWAVSQALASLGYARLGTAGRPGAAWLLLGGTAAANACVALAAAMTAVIVRAPGEPAQTGTVLFGAGLGVYMVGATVLMVLGAERLLLAALSPGVLGGVAYVLAGRPPRFDHAVWAALAATPLLALALSTVRASRDARGNAAGGRLRATELRGALTSAGFGLVAAGLLVFPLAAGNSDPSSSEGAQLACLPLALSMGAAEWALVWFRRRTQGLLRSTSQIWAFAASARLALAAAVAQYLSAAVVLTTAVMVIAAATRVAAPGWNVIPQIVTYLALGGAMYVALVLQAFGIRGLPLLCCAAALALEVLWRRVGVVGQVVACSELFVVLTGYATLTLGRVGLHAY